MICLPLILEILKSHAVCWLTYKFPVQQLRLLQTRNSALLLVRKYQYLFQIRKRRYYSGNNTKIVLSLSLTAIEHFHAELRLTNICGVTRRLFIGIIQARCSCCLLDNKFWLFCRSLCVFAYIDLKYLPFFQINLHLSLDRMLPASNYVT